MATRAGTGNGANGPGVLANGVANAGAPTAEPLTHSQPTNSAADNALSGQDVLAILENALWRVKDRWGPVRVAMIRGQSVLALPNEIRYCPKCQHLRVLADMNGDSCRHCAAK